jgi:hypothetical protein
MFSSGTSWLGRRFAPWTLGFARGFGKTGQALEALSLHGPGDFWADVGRGLASSTWKDADRSVRATQTMPAISAGCGSRNTGIGVLLVLAIALPGLEYANERNWLCGAVDCLPGFACAV